MQCNIASFVGVARKGAEFHMRTISFSVYDTCIKFDACVQFQIINDKSYPTHAVVVDFIKPASNSIQSEHSKKFIFNLSKSARSRTDLITIDPVLLSPAA